METHMEVDLTQSICFVHPPKGEALKTQFHITCNEDEITEKDLPLLFSWMYRTSTNGTWKSITYPSDGK